MKNIVLDLIARQLTMINTDDLTKAELNIATILEGNGYLKKEKQEYTDYDPSRCDEWYEYKLASPKE